MDTIASELKGFERYISYCTYRRFTHNHVPVTRLVENCNYCKCFGNVFLNGPLKAEDVNEKIDKFLIYK